jgi:ribosomal protein S18 acetylase RimI-like enzyme
MVEPWEADDFVRFLKWRHAIGRVALHEGFVQGYVLYLLGRHEVEIARLAVWPSQQRKGIGADLVRPLADRLHGRRSQVVALVPDDRLPAQLFLRKLGFRATRIEAGDDQDHYRFVYEARRPQP